MKVTGETVAVVLKLASGLCALVAAVLFVLPLEAQETGTPAPEEPAEAPVPSQAPEPKPTGLTREERSAFDGAILMVESEPSGATVHVDGKNQGDTPVSIGLECKPGKTVIIDFTLPGFEKTRHRTTCPTDSLVKVTAQLRKASRGGSRKP